MRTTAVIIHFGPTRPTVRLARELAEFPSITTVVVVANDLRPRPAELGDTAIWLVPPRNLGFGGGFRYACETHPAADCHVLLNNDVRLTRRTVDDCLRLLARPDVGIVAPTQVNAAGIHPGVDGLTRVFGCPPERRTPSDDPDDVPWANGAVLFVKAECHRQVPMAERYFLVYEDTDLCFRARAAGWRVVVSPSIVWHSGGGTIPSVGHSYYATRNRIWFARAHGRRRQVAMVVLWQLALLPGNLAVWVLRGNGLASARCFAHGIVDGLLRMPRTDTLLPDEPRPTRWGAWTVGRARRKAQPAH